MSTFRELFDEEERGEVLFALIARKNSFVSQLTKASRTEKAPNVRTMERLEEKIERLERMIRTVAEESN